MTEITPINHIELGLSRLAAQFKTAKNLNDFLTIFLNQNQELENTFFDLLNKRDLDSAVGAQLDVIGRIVGQPRTIINGNVLGFFTFDDLNSPSPDPDLGFGDFFNPLVGGVWLSYGQNPNGNIILDDELYLFFIKAKILKNFTQGTPEEVIAQLQFLLSVNGVVPLIYFTEGGANVVITIGRKLTRNERAVLMSRDAYGKTLVIKPVGVGMKFGQFDGDNVFSFADDPHGKGFGDFNDPDVGGVWAEIIT